MSDRDMTRTRFGSDGMYADQLNEYAEEVARLRAQVSRLQHAIHIHNRDRLRVTLQLDDMGQLPPLDVPPIAEERNGLLFGDLAPLEDDDAR